MKLKLFILSNLIFLFTSCGVIDGVKGKGPVTTKTIETLSDFNAIKISRGLDVELVNGQKNSATIKANENLLDIIEVTVDGNTLVVTANKNIYSATQKKVTVTYKNIERLNINSGCSVSNKGVIKNKNLSLSIHSGANANLNTVSDNLDCEVHSGSSLDIEGFTNTLDIEAHSGASVKAQNLKSKNTTAGAHSGASLKVYSSEHFKAEAHSGGSIRYAGNPQKVSKSNHSGGSISKI